MRQKNNKLKTALVVKLTPIELLDSAVMRMIGVVNGLCENGYDVTILATPFFGELTHELQPCLQRSKVIRLGSGGSTVYNSLGSGSKIKKSIRNILSKTARKLYPYDNSYAYLKYVNIKMLPEDQYNVVISLSDPKTSHLAVKKLIMQGFKYSKWVQYWGDPFTYDITSELIYPKFMKKSVERELMGNADRIVYVSPFTLEVQKNAFKNKADKMYCCVPPYLKTRLVEKEENGRFDVGYFGSYMTVARNILPLYEACAEIDDIHMTIVGNGDVTLEGKENITVLPRGEVEKMEDNTDLLVCILNSRGTQIPGKIYHYAATNKAILVITDGENGDRIREFLSEFDRYYFCKNDKDSIIKAISEIKNDTRKWTPCTAFESGSVAYNLIGE